MHRQCCGLLCGLVFAIGASAGPEDRARQWLAESKRIATGIEPSGVYSEFELARLGLSRAMVYACMGDATNTYKHLLFPPGITKQPEWLSGGDGMVRQLLVSLEFYEIHRTLLRKLAFADKIYDAFDYAYRLSDQQGRDGIYYDLGQAIANPDLLPAAAVARLTEADRAQVLTGVIQGLLAANKTGQARRLFKSIDPVARAAAFNTQVTLLSLAGQWQPAGALLTLAAQASEVDERNLQNAINMAARNGEPETALALIERLDMSLMSDSLLAQIASIFALAGQLDRARDLLPKPGGVTRSWEQVGIQTSANDWLEQYYLAIADPWRRSERLSQMAKRLLGEGNDTLAEHLAGRAEEAAAQITSAQTQALAYQLLTEFYAEAGKPVVVQRLIGKTTAEERSRLKAEAQLAKAWAVVGQPGKAQAHAEQIADAMTRVNALTLAAGQFSAAGAGSEHYQSLIAAAQAACRLMPADRQRGAAWQSVADRQLTANDINGALATARLAPDATSATQVLDAILSHQLENADFDAAIQTARLIPPNPDRHQREPSAQDKSTGRVVVALGAAGHGVRAAELLETITHKAIREINTPPVTRALVAQGEVSRAVDLIAGLSRSDSRGDALSAVLWTSAEKRELPALSLLEFVPKRRGAGLCWAAAAASETGIESLQGWLTGIKNPMCRAYAYAGAAYSLVAADEVRQPAVVFAFVDPQKTTERMGTAMQRQAAFAR